MQSIVEDPFMYILAMTRGTKEGQLRYTETRISDIEELNTPILIPGAADELGIPIIDVIRIFHGDGPARQFESGQSKGGSYPCSNCPIQASLTANLLQSQKLPRVTLEEKRKTIMKKGVISRTNLEIDPNSLNKQSLIAELKALQKIKLGDENKTVELLKDKVKKHYKGCISIPALCYTNPDINLNDTPLKSYEIAPGEIMHDLKEHTVHLLLELPRHISDRDNRLEVCGIITQLRGSGTSACHYRKVLISLLKYTKIIEKIGIKIYNILRFLSEMSHILYSKEESRCSRQVLRYQLCAFHHTILLIELFQVKEPKMSRSLFFWAALPLPFTAYGRSAACFQWCKSLLRTK